MPRSSLAFADDYLEQPEYPEMRSTPSPRRRDTEASLTVSSYTLQIETFWSDWLAMRPGKQGSLAYETVGNWLTGTTPSEYSTDPDVTVFELRLPDLPPASTIEAEQEPAWRAPLVLGLARVLQLPEGWDSYNAPRVNQKAANEALHLLESAAGDAAPAPIVVPTSEGGVQLEWHDWGVDLEVVVSPHEPPELFFRDRTKAEESYQQLGADLATLREALKVLADRAGQEGGL